MLALLHPVDSNIICPVSNSTPIPGDLSVVGPSKVGASFPVSSSSQEPIQQDDATPRGSSSGFTPLTAREKGNRRIIIIACLGEREEKCMLKNEPRNV